MTDTDDKLIAMALETLRANPCHLNGLAVEAVQARPTLLVALIDGADKVAAKWRDDSNGQGVRYTRRGFVAGRGVIEVARAAEFVEDGVARFLWITAEDKACGFAPRMGAALGAADSALRSRGWTLDRDRSEIKPDPVGEVAAADEPEVNHGTRQDPTDD